MQRYFNNVANQKGGAIAGASVLVQNFSDLTTATIYSTNSAIAANIATNPMTTLSDGSFFFYAADGRYNLVVVPSGGTTSTVYDQILEDVVGDGVPVAAIASTATWALGAAIASTSSHALQASTSTVALIASTATWALGAAVSSTATTALVASTATWALGAAVASTSTVALVASTATYSITASTATSVKGTPTNNSAAAGYVGEYISSNVVFGSAVTLVTNTSTNVTSIVLTPGDWDVSGSIGFNTAATTSRTALLGCISTASSTLASAELSARVITPATTDGGGVSTYAIPTQKIAVSSATTSTAYLVALGVFTTSSLTAFGFIGARRAW